MIGDPTPPNYPWVKPFDFSVLPAGKTAVWNQATSEWVIVDITPSAAN